MHVEVGLPRNADMIVEHGDRKKDLKELYLTISDQDLLDAIDRRKFNRVGGQKGGVFSANR